MFKKISNLINVKSIITILLTFLFCYAVITNIIDGGSFKDIYLLIISFYFGTQHEKNNKESEK